MSQSAEVHSRFITVDSLETHYLEAGSGEPLVLLHGGEFGGSAELGWERNFEELAKHYHVIAPDWLGYGQSAKVHDFVLGVRKMVLHLARFLEELGITDAPFVGNSIAGTLLLADAASEAPLLPANRIVSVCGGGKVDRNEHVTALFDYDGSIEAMQRLLVALFHKEEWNSNPAYLQRRHQISLEPGAWEAVASARFRRPTAPDRVPATPPAYERISVPTLLIEGQYDKLKPSGWATEVAEPIPSARVVVIEDAGHCPQIEQTERFHEVLFNFLRE
ncbi:alpha/beta fold hydrolase [Arthrobacter sp. B0490]|uniref:alpha/beta fold hydrolase n=1 Tax=Arthrobacter sp. B0490 TaxID=2058891 RepID=UPI000CE4EAA7|nr:alpha/beta hydrolase [Arthrobacter sp. B0490]